MLEIYEQLTQEEQEKLQDVIRQLYRQTFLLERKYDKKAGRMIANKDFYFCDKHMEFLTAYFAVAGVRLNQNTELGTIWLQGEATMGERLPKLATIYLLLLKLIYDASLVSDYVEYTGQILTQGTLLGYLPQEFPDAWKKETIYSYCVGTPAFTDLSPKELAAIASQLCFPLTFFTLTSFAERFPAEKRLSCRLLRCRWAVLISIFWTSLQTILILKRWNGWSISSTAAENRCFLSPTMRL